MAMTYRRQRIVEFVVRLIRKKEILREQINEPEFATDVEKHQWQIQTLDTVIREMISEFDITEEDFK